MHNASICEYISRNWINKNYYFCDNTDLAIKAYIFQT
jgi:hypothetical protein